jgi:hypothetical protein
VGATSSRQAAGELLEEPWKKVTIDELLAPAEALSSSRRVG